MKINEQKVNELLKTEKVKKQKGATMIEYALVVAGIAAIAAIVFTGSTADGTVGGAIESKVIESVSGTTTSGSSGSGATGG